jgi:hypothetical protein
LAAKGRRTHRALPANGATETVMEYIRQQVNQSISSHQKFRVIGRKNRFLLKDFLEQRRLGKRLTTVLPMES